MNLTRRSNRSWLVALAALTMTAAMTTPAVAQASGGSTSATADTARGPKPLKWGTGAWTFGAYMGQFNDEPEWQPDGGPDQLERGALFGGRVGYNFPFNLFIQGEASNSLLRTTLVTGDISRNTNLYLLGGVVGFNIQPMQNLQIFPEVGVGAAIFKPDLLSSETQVAYLYGAGFRYFVSSKLAVRGDLRWHQIPNAMQGIRDKLAGSAVPHPDLWGMELSGGLSLFVGGPSDADHDNVDDASDACPDTPRGYPVDARGCPLDSDGDGVPDAIDQCPGTMHGAIVDSHGCAIDTDGDGVPNGIDQCPGTAAGQKVDDRGCPPGLIILKNVPIRLDQLGVYFNFNQATLRPGSSVALNLVGQALSEMSGVEIEVQGYTDAIGTEAYNLRLSRRRAETVRDYLVQHFPKLDASRFTVKAFGESNPVASNATPAGREQNRRVILVVGGGSM